MCCDAPAPPDTSAPAAATEKAAELAYQSGAEDLAFRKQVYQDSLGDRQRLLDLATKIANQQLGIADENQGFAREQQNYYRNSFMPNEQQTIADAYGQQYLGSDDRAQLNALITGGGGNMTDAARLGALQAFGNKAEEGAASDAGQRAASSAALTYGQAQRGLSRRSIDPSKLSSAYASLALQQQATQAGAENNARQAVRDRGVALRTGVANFGRNMPNTAAQSYGLATNAGSSAVANQNTGYMSGLPYAQFQTGGYGTQLGAAGLAQQGALGLGNLQNQVYGNQVQAYAGQMAALGTAAGVGTGLYMRK